MIDKNYFNNEKQTEKYVEKLRMKVDIVFESAIMPFLFISATLVFFATPENWIPKNIFGPNLIIG